MCKFTHFWHLMGKIQINGDEKFYKYSRHIIIQCLLLW